MKGQQYISECQNSSRLTVSSTATESLKQQLGLQAGDSCCTERWSACHTADTPLFPLQYLSSAVLGCILKALKGPKWTKAECNDFKVLTVV